MSVDTVEIYVDGAALPSNPGRGGAGVVLMTEINGTPYKKAFGRFLGESVTNNEAEIRAAIVALSALKKPCAVTVFSDSQYLVKTMTDGWKRNANPIWWDELDRVAGRHTVTWRWIKGHNGDEYNETAHNLAELAAQIREDVDDAD